MEDQTYQATEESINGRLAISTLRFLGRYRAGRVERSERDVERLQWLRELLRASLGGARRLSWNSQALAPALPQTFGSASSEMASYRTLRRFSKADSPEDHAAWVQRADEALDNLQSNGGWDSLSADRQRAVEDLEPLLEWLAGAEDRNSHTERNVALGV
jgi:hypothetical protein